MKVKNKIEIFLKLLNEINGKENILYVVKRIKQ